MAKSKSGGTRAYIRGRVGSDVYSIGMTANGKKQQVVRSLAETVKNPQTINQMRGRMIMSTVMQACSALRPIIDHSFDNVPSGQPCVSEFIKRNYALIKTDVADHPASGNSFGLNEYQEKGIKPGKYEVSDGTAIANPNLSCKAAETMKDEFVLIPLAGATFAKLSDIADAIDLGENDYITLIILTAGGVLKYARLKYVAPADATVAPTTQLVQAMFEQEGNAPVNITFDSNTGFVTFDFGLGTVATSILGGFINTDYVDGKYTHSPLTLAGFVLNENTADDALPTYPVGSAEGYINGAEL